MVKFTWQRYGFGFGVRLHDPLIDWYAWDTVHIIAHSTVVLQLAWWQFMWETAAYRKLPPT